jgi:S-adenosylhomocysteine hydrolase
MNFEEIQYGFQWGPAKIERHISDEKKGFVVMGLKTAKTDLQIYVTKTGKVRVINYTNGRELIES